MQPIDFFTRLVQPTLRLMADNKDIAIPATEEARVMLMAICGQESNWSKRLQDGGPARGYPQFELTGGVDGVFRVTRARMAALCASLDIPFDRATVFDAMAWNDTLSIGMARLLLWTDPQSLPKLGDLTHAWDYYVRIWQPGKPRPADWASNYSKSMAVVSVASKG